MHGRCSFEGFDFGTDFFASYAGDLGFEDGGDVHRLACFEVSILGAYWMNRAEGLDTIGYGVYSGARKKTMSRSPSTAPIKALFLEALDSLNRPLTEDVTDDVFYAIESSPAWLNAYEGLCAIRGKTTVNTWGGYWIANAVERAGQGQVPAQKSKLIQSYSRLDQPASPRRMGKRATEQIAGDAIFEYFKEHKADLPANIQSVKAEILELVVSGMAVDEAFQIALKIADPITK